MSEDPRNSQAISFGPFVFTPSRRTLVKSGHTIRLPEQALRILEILLGQPGKIVLREELQASIWQTGTPADTEHGLNVMVNKLRAVLGDAAKEPRYIETIPRVGYRFVAPVTTHLPQPSVDIPAPEPEPALQLAPVVKEVKPAPGRHRRLWAAAVGLVALLFVVAVLGMRNPHETPAELVIPILSLPGDKNYPAFSPDGKQIAFAWTGKANPGEPHRDIYIGLINAGDPLRLTSDPGDELLPAWSPDGRYIAFLGDEKRSPSGMADRAVYVIPALGGQERRICSAGAGVSWSHDGNTLAIAGPADEHGRNQIYLVSLKTGEQTLFTQPGQWSDSFPRFSPDGKHIAFLRSFTRAVREIMIAPAGGGEPVRLTVDKRPVWGFSWMPDSRSIVYSSNRGNGETIWQLAIHGGGQPQRIVTSQAAFEPTVSPLGDAVAYVESYTDSNLYLYNGPQFDNATQIAASSREEHSPALSPDGKMLAFVSKRTGNDEIWIAPRSGGTPHQLTAMNGPATGSPQWSPDNLHVAFDSRAAGSADVYVIGRDGSGARQLTSDKSEDMNPSWSADGKYIYFCSDRSGRHEMWKMPVSGGSPVQVTRGGAWQGFESPDGKQFYFARPFAQKGIWSIPVSGGAERPVPELAEAGLWRSWAVNRQGLFYVPSEAEQGRFAVRLYRFDTGQTTPLFWSATAPPRLQSGLASNLDGSAYVFSKTDHIVNEIVMVENFRGLN